MDIEHWDAKAFEVAFVKELTGAYNELAAAWWSQFSSRERRTIRRRMRRGLDCSRYMFKPNGTPIKEIIDAALQKAIKEDKQKRLKS